MVLGFFFQICIVFSPWFQDVQGKQPLPFLLYFPRPITAGSLQHIVKLNTFLIYWISSWQRIQLSTTAPPQKKPKSLRKKSNIIISYMILRRYIYSHKILDYWKCKKHCTVIGFLRVLCQVISMRKKLVKLVREHEPMANFLMDK